MAEYQFTLDGAVIRRSDGATIPTDDGNRDYQQYLAWREAGNTPDPADPPPEPEPSKNDILGMLLDTADPDDPDPTIVYLVLREMLTP